MADRLNDSAYHFVRCRGTKRDLGIADYDADCVCMTQIAQIVRKYLESLSHDCGIIIRYS